MLLRHTPCHLAAEVAASMPLLTGVAKRSPLSVDPRLFRKPLTGQAWLLSRTELVTVAEVASEEATVSASSVELISLARS